MYQIVLCSSYRFRRVDIVLTLLRRSRFNKLIYSKSSVVCFFVIHCQSEWLSGFILPLSLVADGRATEVSKVSLAVPGTAFLKVYPLPNYCPRFSDLSGLEFC